MSSYYTTTLCVGATMQHSGTGTIPPDFVFFAKIFVEECPRTGVSRASLMDMAMGRSSDPLMSVPLVVPKEISADGLLRFFANLDELSRKVAFPPFSKDFGLLKEEDLLPCADIDWEDSSVYIRVIWIDELQAFLSLNLGMRIPLLEVAERLLSGSPSM